MKITSDHLDQLRRVLQVKSRLADSARRQLTNAQSLADEIERDDRDCEEADLLAVLSPVPQV